MSYTEPARTAGRRTPWLRVAGLLVAAALAAACGYPLLTPFSSAGAPPIGALRDWYRGALDESDGVLPDGTTAFDDRLPGIANLDPALLRALRRAAADAADDGVALFVTSGWRSAAYQERLLREAIVRYGSAEEAARWVASADTSPHVAGEAVDIGRLDATAWLSEHGVEYGLCQVYSNEPWHYELRPEAIERGCPPLYADPTHDPRMREGGSARELGSST